MEKINMEKKLLVSASPHIRDHISTRRIMLDVVIALAPAALLGIYYHGLRAALLIAVCIVSCVLFEYIAVRIRKKPASIGDCSAIVTGLLLAMSLPPGLPVWMAVLGCFIAIVIIKQLFGGIGQNFVNPAVGARVFLTVSFAQAMTTWVEPGTDVISTATPLAIMKDAEAVSAMPDFLDMFLGNIGGCIGETSAIALILGGIYLLARTVITWHIPVFYLGTVQIYHELGIRSVPSFLVGHDIDGQRFSFVLFGNADFELEPRMGVSFRPRGAVLVHLPGNRRIRCLLYILVPAFRIIDRIYIRQFHDRKIFKVPTRFTDFFFNEIHGRYVLLKRQRE
jgi:Na+-transporting NADH:ubiquinone oxidoreductase subunit NqrB